MLDLKIEPEFIGQRLDVCLTQLLKGEFSRAQIQSLIKAGNVSINNEANFNSSYKIKQAGELKIILPQLQEAVLSPQAVDFKVLYEDNDLIVIEKPSGLVVHPGAGNFDKTLVNGLLYHCAGTLSGIGGVKRPGIVHRLDKNTSGVMVVAKHDKAHHFLSEQFADHGKKGKLKRKYLALVWNSPKPTNGVIENYLARSKRDRTKRTIVAKEAMGAKLAITEYQVKQMFLLQNSKEVIASLVECSLKTGRTHQIRVHMADKKAPLIGDKEYGADLASKVRKLPIELQHAIAQLKGQALHAYFLQFEHPADGKLMRFETSLPTNMLQILQLFNNKEIFDNIEF